MDIQLLLVCAQSRSTKRVQPLSNLDYCETRLILNMPSVSFSMESADTVLKYIVSGTVAGAKPQRQVSGRIHLV